MSYASATTCPSRSSYLLEQKRRRSYWTACVPVSAERTTYADSSAIIKLAVREHQRVLDRAGRLRPHQLRSLDAVHLATADLLGTRNQTLIVTYDHRMADAARELGWRVAAPA